MGYLKAMPGNFKLFHRIGSLLVGFLMLVTDTVTLRLGKILRSEPFPEATRLPRLV
jgi:hypothetical protein